MLGFLVYKLLGVPGIGRRGLHLDPGAARTPGRQRGSWRLSRRTPACCRSTAGPAPAPAAAAAPGPAFSAPSTAAGAAPAAGGPASVRCRAPRGGRRRGGRTAVRRAPAAPAAPAAPTAADHRRVAPRRLLGPHGALLLDVLLVGILTSVLNHTHDLEFIALLAAYGAVMWKLRGSTVGGIVFDLRVVRLDGGPSTGKPPSSAHSAASCPWRWPAWGSSG